MKLPVFILLGITCLCLACNRSISKNFTALAALIAAQDSLIHLDVPVSAYLPDFTVKSCFEVHPEHQISIRRMLTHTGGFTHEAP